MSSETQDRLDRRAVVAELLRDRGELLVVTGLGSSVKVRARSGPIAKTRPLRGVAEELSSGRISTSWPNTREAFR